MEFGNYDIFRSNISFTRYQIVYNKLYYLLVSTLHFYANVKESYITHKLSILKTPILISRNVFIIPVFY